MSKKKPAAEAPKVPYQPTERERAQLSRFKARQEVTPKRGSIQVKGNTVESDHPEDHGVGWKLIMANLGTCDPHVMESVSSAIVNATQENGEANEEAMQRALAHLQGLAPRDELELMLALQMTLVHLAVARTAQRLHCTKVVDQTAIYSNALTKLSRTFTAQVDTLKKYRSKGEQRVVVEHQHVHVHPGGQAVVGTVNHGGSGEAIEENGGQPHGRDPMRIPQRPPMLREVQADGLPVQGTSGEGPECVSLPRRQGRSASG